MMRMTRHCTDSSVSVCATVRPGGHTGHAYSKIGRNSQYSCVKVQEITNCWTGSLQLFQEVHWIRWQCSHRTRCRVVPCGSVPRVVAQHLSFVFAAICRTTP